MMTENRSDIFRRMAVMIDANVASEFGGAFIICPPQGDPIEALVLSKADLGSFYGMLRLKLDLVADEIKEKERQQQIFRR